MEKTVVSTLPFAACILRNMWSVIYRSSVLTSRHNIFTESHSV